MVVKAFIGRSCPFNSCLSGQEVSRRGELRSFFNILVWNVRVVVERRRPG
jgi:hypothetical protein